MSEVELRPEETIIRKDLAVIGRGAETTTKRKVHPKLFCMQIVLTNQRLIIRKPPWRDLIRYTSSVYNFDRKPFEIELRFIKRLWKWQPEFSGPPMIEAAGRVFTLALATGRGPNDLEYAPFDAVREHFEALEAAWIAARAEGAK